MTAASPVEAAAALGRGYAETRRAIKACEDALKRLERDNEKELRALRRTLRGGRAGDTYVAESELFQSWRARRETLATDLRRLKAALDDPRGTLETTPKGLA
ncbi:hypothetical protein [Caulobacter sp. 17J80-11]|uniref:hypothetical protein n=1 Tax=Caulobacter sp. 17J80-11 TaxID=2763502 RepID=UPI001653ED4C|nr:hypothetical protein [Caulobacter sp. 17J80-11]MBC6981198.1 hypothetical protein [Caulobacter sp. 17J80-11]